MSLQAVLAEPMLQRALLVALLTAALMAYLGVFVVLKRIVFVGAALAEVSGFGAALAFFPPVIWAFEALLHAFPALEFLHHYLALVLGVVFMLLAVAFFSQPRLGRQLPREAIIGLTYAGALGLTVFVLAANPSSEAHAQDLLSGNIISVEDREVWELVLTGIVVAAIQALFYKEFLLVSFDPEVARTLGYRASRWEFFWYLTLGSTIAVAIHVSGTLLVFAYLVIPPVTALMLSRRLWVVFLLSVLFATLATVCGILLSVLELMVAEPPEWLRQFPASPSIIAFLVLFFVVAWLAGSATRLARGRE